MNENLVMEEDTIYEIDPVCMRQKQKREINFKREEKNIKWEEARKIKGEEQLGTKFDFKMLIIVIIILTF